jgi:hypothetical protein
MSFQKAVTPQWLVVGVPSVIFCVNPNFTKRQSFKLDPQKCTTRNFHERLLGIYKKAIYFLAICDCRYIS